MLRFYNTLQHKIVPFKPLKKGVVTIYSCGPTVYDFPHIGDLRRYLTDDILYRALKSKGFAIKRIINITDVGHLTQDDIDSGEDKIIKAAVRENKTPLQIAQYYTNQFLRDAKRINLATPDRYARATDHIKDMQNLVARLIKKGYAYEIDGNVYFDVSKYKEYGKLSRNTLKNLRVGVRPELKKAVLSQKKSPADFVLWVKASPQHLLQWPSPWGRGYPGWHTECAAIILSHFGPTIDIHTGGQDNIFPHHEDEIAQSQAVTGRPLANYWLHTKHLLVNNQKMSKRENTFITLDDLIKKGFDPLSFRFLALSAHYSSPLNFTWSAQAAALSGWQRVRDFAQALRQSAVRGVVMSTKSKKLPAGFKESITQMHRRFFAHIDDDLGTPKALAVLSKLINFGNSEMRKQNFSIAKQEALLELLLSFNDILAILPTTPSIATAPARQKKILSLLRRRRDLKKQKKYQLADRVRDNLIELGVEVKDTVSGIAWKDKKTGQNGLIKL